MREVVVDLPPHALDFMRESSSADFGQSGGLRAVGLLREHGERRLQSVREIAGLGLRARDARVARLEQRVEIRHERLHFGGIVAVHQPLAAGVHVREPRAQLARPPTSRGGPA